MVLLGECANWLQNSLQTIASANPDIIEFSFSVSLPIDVPGANLTESTSPSLIVGNYSTDGSITSTGSGVVTFTFNTALRNGMFSDDFIIERGNLLAIGRGNLRRVRSLKSLATTVELLSPVCALSAATMNFIKFVRFNTTKKIEISDWN